MATFNYIEELGIECETPSTDQRISKALETYRIITMLCESKAETTRREARFNEMNQEFSQNGAALFKQHQAELKAVKQNQLKDLIKLMQELHCAKLIHPMRAKGLAEALQVKPDTVTKAYRSSGFEVKNAVGDIAIDSFFIPDTTYNKIATCLKNLRTYFSSINVQAVDRSMHHLIALKDVDNLYSFLSIYDDKGVAGDAYRVKQASELFGLCQKFTERDELSQNSSQTPRSEFKDLMAAGKEMVFKTEALKTQYDHKLALEQSGVLDQLLMMKDYPDGVKLDHSLTEAFITRISSAEGCDRATSIAIYNQIVSPNPRLADEETRVFVTCPSCHNVSIFDDQEEAQKAECPNCKTKLYMKCPNPQCGKIVPAAAERCDCGFVISGLRFYKSYFERCEMAIRQQNLKLANEEYNNALRSNPAGEGLKELAKKLAELEDALGKPLKEIGNLIDAKKMYAAQAAITQLVRKRPSIDVAQYNAQVNRALVQANTEYARCRQAGISVAQKVDICTRVLEIVSDYDAAVSEIIANPPEPVLRVSAAIDTAAMSCSINWAPNPNNRNVSYVVVRKIGGNPQSVEDGIKTEGILATSFKDTNLEAGKDYCYAVFVARAVCSASVSKPAYPGQPVVLLKEIGHLRADSNGQSCTLSWQDQPGSLGVSIERSDDNGSTWQLLTDRVQNSFNDKKGLRNEKIYRYKVKTAWVVGGKVVYSAGITRDVKVETKPDPLKISALCDVDGNCKLSWNPQGAGVVWLFQLKDTSNVTAGMDYDQNQLETLGGRIGQVAIANGSFTHMLGANARARVVAFRPYGDRVVAGEAITLSTIPPLKIKETSVINGSLRIMIEQPSQNVTRILYQVSTSSAQPYATEQTAKQGAMSGIDVAAYRAAGSIVVNKMPEALLYVSVIAQYGSGAQAYFSPVATKEVSNMPKEKIKYRLIWREEGMFKKRQVRKGAKIEICLDGNRIPAMALCAHRSGKMLFKYQQGNPEIVNILEVTPNQSRGSIVTFDLDVNRMSGLPANADLQLFLLGDEYDRYEMPLCIDIPSRKLPME